MSAPTTYLHLDRMDGPVRRYKRVPAFNRLDGYNVDPEDDADSRIAAKVNFLASPPEHAPELGSCWQWTGGVNSSGYAAISVGGFRFQLHRYSYERAKGPIPDGMVIDHLCRNRSCCNPAHLEPVTVHENWRRGTSPTVRFSRQTHCKRGHELSGDNLHIINSTGSRQCKACKNMNSLKAYHAESLEKREIRRAKARNLDARTKMKRDGK